MTRTRPLRVGVQLPEAEREVRWPEMRAMARTAEEVGLDSVWVGDHLLYRDEEHGSRGPWEAWSLLAALGETTDRVEIGPLVAATSFHNPAMLAKKAATVDDISGGRLILGLGAGWNELEYRAFGFPFDHRASRFEEAFTIIRTLLREGFIDFSGRYYEARECELLPRSPRAGGPPLMIGSIGARVLRIAAPHVEMWNAWHAWFGNSPGGLAEMHATVDAACRDVGRDPAEVARTVAVMVQMSGGTGRIHGSPGRPGSLGISGQPEPLAAELAAYAAAGVAHAILVLDPITEASIAALAPTLDLLDAD